MLEKYQLKSCRTTVLLKILSLIFVFVTFGVTTLIFYQPKEEYSTVEDVKKSRAFTALVDATKEIWLTELNQGIENWETEDYMIDGIAWIYEARLNGYNLYSRIDYTFGEEKKTAYCKTYCGDVLTRQGMKYTESTELISESSYANQHSILINSEQEYNDLAVSTVVASFAKELSSSVRGYNNLVSLLKERTSFLDTTIHSIAYTHYTMTTTVTAPSTTLFKIEYTATDGNKSTAYYMYSFNTHHTDCTALAQSQYDYWQRELYNSGYAFEGTYNKLVIASALTDAREGT